MTAKQVRAVFAGVQAATPALGVTGRVGTALKERLQSDSGGGAGDAAGTPGRLPG